MSAEELIEAATADAQRAHRAEFSIPVVLDIAKAMSVIACLQVALRHPGVTGPSSSIALEFIEGLIRTMRESGFEACAKLAELGFNSQYDV